MEAITLQQIAPFIGHKLQSVYFEFIDNEKTDLGGFETVEITGLDFQHNKILIRNGYVTERDSIKPILHPISSITKPIIHNGVEIVPIVELARMVLPKNIEQLRLIGNRVCSEGLNFEFYFNGSDFRIVNRVYDAVAENQLQLFQKLAEWHINFLNIPDHLFIDKSTVKI